MNDIILRLHTYSRLNLLDFLKIKVPTAETASQRNSTFTSSKMPLFYM